MIRIYYLSGDKKKRIDLDRHPYWMETGNFLDYRWETVSRNRRIRGFQKNITEKQFTITISGSTGQEYKDNWKYIHDVFESDVYNMTPGYLYFGPCYLRCYINAADMSDWEQDSGECDCTYTVTTDNPLWIRENSRQFFPGSQNSSAVFGISYPYDYPYEYAPMENGTALWNTGFVTDSEFLMTIYGPCSDPRILVNGYPYQVYDVLEENDYIVIDSRKNTVMKYLANGTTQNLYDMRAKKYRVFERIPGGNLTVNWNGSFGFDVVLYNERSVPEWS